MDKENMKLLQATIKVLLNKRVKNETTVIEETLISCLLSPYPEAMQIVQNRLFDNKSCINQDLSDIFRNNAPANDYHACHDNFEPLVQYLSDLEHKHPTFVSPDDTELPYAADQLRLLEDHFTILKKEVTDPDKRFFYAKQATVAGEYAIALMSIVTYCNIEQLYNFILENWSDLKSLSVTYRLISSTIMMRTQNIFYITDLIELLENVISVTEKWNK